MTMNKDQRKILATVRKHFKSRKAQDALALLTEHNDPVLWDVFREGVSFSPDKSWPGLPDFRGVLDVSGGEIKKRVKSYQRDQVALHVARHTGLLDEVTEMVYFSCGNLWDLSPLAGLKLTRLCFNGLYDAEDFSALGQLPALHDLEILSTVNLRDASTFAALTQLRRLCLFECGVVDLAPMAGMNGLQRLSLFNRPQWTQKTYAATAGIVDLTPIRSLGALVELRLNCAYGCRGLDDLTCFPHLQVLGLAGPGVCAIPDLSSHSDLTALRINDATVTNLTPLSALTQLERLNLDGLRDLCDLSPLQGLRNLKELSIQNCRQLTDLSPLAGLTNLTTLDLSYCKSVSDLSPLAGLTNLTTLDLSYCKSVSATEVQSLQAALPNLTSSR